MTLKEQIKQAWKDYQLQEEFCADAQTEDHIQMQFAKKLLTIGFEKADEIVPDPYDIIYKYPTITDLLKELE